MYLHKYTHAHVLMYMYTCTFRHQLHIYVYVKYTHIYMNIYICIYIYHISPREASLFLLLLPSLLVSQSSPGASEVFVAASGSSSNR